MLEGKLALVTGASRGIGYQAALAYAKAGAHVIALARTVGGLEELDDAIKNASGTATLVPLDITDYDGLDRLGASINERWGQLDILLANAGILGGLSPLSHFDPKEFEKVISTNLTANWRLIRSLEPLLKRSESGRAIFVSSGAAHSIRAFWGPYTISKIGLEALVKTWVCEIEKSQIKANIFDPGAVRTAMRALAKPGEDPSTLPEAVTLTENLIMMASQQNQNNGQTFSQPEGKWL